MSIINLSGLDDRESRLSAASKILKKKVTSYTELDKDDIDQLYQAFSAWMTIQHKRFDNGSSLKEACAIWDLMSDETKLLLNDRGVLPNQSNRRNIPMSTEEVDKELAELKEMYSAKSVAEASKNISLSSKTSPIVNSTGRWDRWRLIESPSVGLGLSMGVGGIPRGRVIQFWGKNHAGKSMVAQQISANAIKQGIPVFYFDTETAISPDFAQHLGLDSSHELFNLLTPKSTEQLCEDIRHLADKGVLIVVDSLGSSESQNEIDRKLDKSPKVGGNAQVIKSTLSLSRYGIASSGTTIILVNQARAKMNPGMYEDPIRPFGSEAILHNSDIIYKVEKVKEQKQKLKDMGYENAVFRNQKNRLTSMTNARLAFKPGFAYNKSLDLIRSASQSMGVDENGNQIIYEDAAGKPIATDFVAENDGEKSLIGKASRYSIKVDSLMLAAILKDEPDFDDGPFTDNDIEPCDNETLQKFIDTHDSGSEDLYNSPEAVWGWFTIPGRGEGAAFTWLQRHPLAKEILIDRLYNSLNHKHELVSEVS